MCIDVIGDDSISTQARTYAEYRLFAALSQGVGTGQVRSASIVLRRAKSRRNGEGVVCAVTVELNEGEVSRLKASGAHPYAAINRAVERLQLRPWRVRPESLDREVIST
jgi:ribosome-associated translation inhibitor RaiA